MPFNLFITTPNGSTRKALNSPYVDRKDTIRTVRMVVVAEGDVYDERAQTFAERVSKYPLGETITHTDLNISFRTEEI